MSDTPDTNVDDAVVTYLLKEYDTLLKLRQDSVAMGDNRFNFYLLILSGAAIFITWINSSEPVNVSKNVVAYITIVIIIGVLLLGLTTFVRIARRNSSIVVYARGMARIRRFFVDKCPEIEGYLIAPTHDDEPVFGRITTSEQLPIMLAIINTLLAGVGISLAMLATFRQLQIAAMSGVIMFIAVLVFIRVTIFIAVLVFLGQYYYYSRHMDRRGRHYPPEFPDIKQMSANGTNQFTQTTTRTDKTHP